MDYGLSPPTNLSCPGLDPGIHAVTPQETEANGMDFRVKPGNDAQLMDMFQRAQGGRLDAQPA